MNPREHNPISHSQGLAIYFGAPDDGDLIDATPQGIAARDRK